MLTEEILHNYTAIAVETCEVYTLSRLGIGDIVLMYPDDYRIIMSKYKKRNQRARFSLKPDDVKAHLIFGKR